MGDQQSSPQPPSQHWDHGRRSHPPQQQRNYGSDSLPPNYAVLYYMPEQPAHVPVVPSVPVPQQQPQPLRRFYRWYSSIADQCHTVEQVIAAAATSGVDISNFIIVQNLENGRFSLYRIEDSPTSCTSWEEATTIIGQAQSKFGDGIKGITSCAPGIETARVVQGRDDQAGHCKCHQCRFLPSAGVNDGGPNGGNQFKWGKDPGEKTGRLNGSSSQGDKPWKQLFSGSCPYDDIFGWLQYPQYIGYGFSHITTLKGHQKDISGIAQTSGPDKLFSGSKDGTVKMWDCQDGQSETIANMGREVGCMISEGHWLFVCIPDSINVWNTQTGTVMSLSGLTGQVHALVVANDMLFAGTEDGEIFVWRYSAQTNCFEPAVFLMGHRGGVTALVVGGTKLYSSGSKDHTIKAWDLTTLQCVQMIPDHTDAVMSLLCWGQFLISCSLDKTVKFWSTNNQEQLEVTYTHNEEHGVLALCGMHDLQGKPVLLCSLNDNSVRLYDLPLFNERGKIFTKQEVWTMQTGPHGIFFTSDGTDVEVWKWIRL